MSLVETLQQNRENEIADAKKRYQQLLGHARSLDDYREILNRDSGKDAEAMASLMEKLGLSTDEVSADLGAIHDYARAGTLIVTDEQLEQLCDAAGRAKELGKQELCALGTQLLSSLEMHALENMLREMERVMCSARWGVSTITGPMSKSLQKMHQAQSMHKTTRTLSARAIDEQERLRRQFPRALASEISSSGDSDLD